MPAVVLNHILRAAILQDWRESKAPFGEPYEKWTEEAAEKYGIPAAKIKSCVAAEAHAFLVQVQQERASEAQQVAMLAGATVARAYEVLVEAMDASKRRFIKDKAGRLIVNEQTGEPHYYDEPLINERLRAAELVIKVNGGFAPQQVEHEHEHEHTISIQPQERLAPDQLWEKVVELADAVRKLQRDNRTPGPDIIGPKPGTASRRSSPGPVLLADYRDEDQGRAG